MYISLHGLISVSYLNDVTLSFPDFGIFEPKPVWLSAGMNQLPLDTLTLSSFPSLVCPLTEMLRKVEIIIMPSLIKSIHQKPE